MTSQQFPKVDSGGKFDVKIGFALDPNCGFECAKEIGKWLIDQWLPANQSWRRKWASGPNGSVVIEETILFSDSFYQDPEVSYQAPDCLIIVLHGKARSAPWRDWMVSRIVPELQAQFPQLGDRLFVEDAK